MQPELKRHLRTIGITYGAMLLVWMIAFHKEGIVENLYLASKLFFLMTAPGLIALMLAYPDLEPLIQGAMGTGVGIVLCSILYFLFGMVHVPLGMSVYLSPMIIVLSGSAIFYARSRKKNKQLAPVAQLENKNEK